MSEIFVSPGVYVREHDFSYYVSSVNESSLAIVGETKKGPAFLPTKISNIAEFKEIFGNLDTNKYAGYCAKSYFKHANQAYIVRVLGEDSLRGAHELISIESTTAVVLATLLASAGTVAVLSDGLPGTTSANTNFNLYLSGSEGNTIYSGDVNLYDANSPVYIETLFPRNNTIINTVDGQGVALNHVFQNETVGLDIESGTVATNTITTGDALDVTTYSSAQSPMIVGDTVDAVNYGTSLFTIYTISDGVEANKDIKVTIENIDTTNVTFDLTVRKFTDTNEAQVFYERFPKLSMDPTNINYIAKAIGDSQDNTGNYTQISKYIYVDVEATAPATALPYGFNPIASPISGASDFPQFPMDLTFSNTVSVKRQYLGVNFETIDSDLLMGGWGSAWNLAGNSDSTIKGFHLNSGSSVTHYQQGPSGSTDYPKSYAKFIIPLLGGSDGWAHDEDTRDLLGTAPTAAQLVQWNAALATIDSTEDYDINLLAIPGVAISSSIGAAGIVFAETRADTFYVGDIGSAPTTAAAAGAIGNALDSNYASTYWPYVKIYDADNTQNVMIPPTPQVLEAIAYTDQVAYPWFAPAGMNRGLLTDVIKTQYKLNLDDRDELYNNKVNPIATLPGQGYAIWGQKTLQTRTTALDRINVRRMMLYIEKVIAGASRYLVFEQNDATTWDRFKNMVQPVLDRVKIKQGLYDFRVIMDETTNTDDMIDRGQMVGQIYIKPTKTAEAILINFNIMPTGAVFEE